MISIKKVVVILLLCLFISHNLISQEKPDNMFTELYEKYQTSGFDKINIESKLSDGTFMLLYDAKNNISKDIYCKIYLFSSLGQTRYSMYKKDGEGIWYFHKEALFYDKPYTLEDAESINTYFKFINNMSYAYNDTTNHYDIQADTRKYQAVVDVRSLTQLIDIIENAVGN